MGKLEVRATPGLRFKYLGALAALGVAVGAAQVRAQNQEGVEKRFEFAELHMGVQVRLVVYAPSEETAKAACRDAFARVAALDQVASDYRPTSELMLLCKYFDTPGLPPKPVSADLWAMLAHSQRVSKASRGGFDVSIGPLVKSWRAARRSQVLPPAAELKEARARVGWKKIALDARSRAVRLKAPGMRLDLGGIAKGYAGDAALQVLARHNIRRALFEAGGDLVASGPPPGTLGWKVRLPEGHDVLLANGALSTSGDTAQWVQVGGRRYSHVVDPRTGLGLSQRWMATVRAPNGAASDALSTAATVTGPSGVKRLLKYFPATRIWVRRAPEAGPAST